MSAGSPDRALAWKEGRRVAASTLVAIACVASLAVVAPHVLPRELGMEAVPELLILLIAPLLAAAPAAAALAPERADGTLGFLVARPVGFRRVLGWKLGIHGLAALVSATAAWVVAAILPGTSLPAWFDAFDAPARLAWPLAVTLAAIVFLATFACSLHLPDALTAAPAGVIAGWAWTVLVLAPGLWLSGSWEVTLLRWPALLPALLGGPALATWIATRLLRVGPARPLSRLGAITLTAGVVVALACLALALREPLDAAAVRSGRAAAVDSPVMENTRGRAVAFVAQPPGGAPRAVIAWLDAPSTADTLVVLPPGTQPLGWEPRGGGLAVTWPGGARRLVPLNSYQHSVPIGSVANFIASPGAFRVEDGRLVRITVQGRDVIYPRDASGGTRP